jgi:hypothetical protein
MDLKEVQWEAVNLIHQTQASCCELDNKLSSPLKVANFMSISMSNLLKEVSAVQK